MIVCRFENGGEGKLRHVTVSAVIVNKEKNRVLLAKRAPSLPNGNLWCLPGGYLDRDETTMQGVLREVYEETGYQTHIVSLLRLIDVPTRPKEDKQNVEFAYVVEAETQKKDKDTETSEIKWYDLDKVPDEKDWAYDHFETFSWFRKWLKKEISLPVFNNKPL